MGPATAEQLMAWRPLPWTGYVKKIFAGRSLVQLKAFKAAYPEAMLYIYFRHFHGLKDMSLGCYCLPVFVEGDGERIR